MPKEYIEREAIGIGKCNLDVFEDKGYAKGWNAVIEIIESTPNADVVEVVRCKDCKYSRDEGMSGLWCDHPDNRNPCGCRPTDYCNDGERKESK